MIKPNINLRDWMCSTQPGGVGTPIGYVIRYGYGLDALKGQSAQNSPQPRFIFAPLCMELRHCFVKIQIQRSVSKMPQNYYLHILDLGPKFNQDIGINSSTHSNISLKTRFCTYDLLPITDAKKDTGIMISVREIHSKLLKFGGFLEGQEKARYSGSLGLI